MTLLEIVRFVKPAQKWLNYQRKSGLADKVFQYTMHTILYNHVDIHPVCLTGTSNDELSVRWREQRRVLAGT